MKYLVVQDWANTHGNHAGMVHLCDMLVDRYPGEYVKVCMPVKDKDAEDNNVIVGFALRVINKITRSLVFLRGIWIKYNMPYSKAMLVNLKGGDSVFLLQYCSSGATQDVLASYIRHYYKGVQIFAMSHQTRTNYLKMGFDANEILKWDSYVDKHILMGSSLATYFKECGVNPQKISVGFHYVDDVYYNKKVSEIVQKERPTVIAIGAMQRDFELLSSIVNSVDSVNWIICRGMKAVDHLFHGNNIKLVGFVPEEELKNLMNESDASINVMGDTVGSNVITTSLAMGLCVVASDVGSIRDYIDESCGYLCQNTKESFVQAISDMASNPEKLVQQRKEALKRGHNLTVCKVHQWFNSL